MISPQGKLLAAIALAPIVADMIDDAYNAGLISTEMNQKHCKNLVYKIRKLDREMMDTAGPVEIQQQIDIQTAFRQWINFNFGEDEGNKE
jgi:hypothetical protein